MTRTVVVVTAGLSQPSTTRLIADRIAASTAAAISARGEAAEIVVLELRELAVDLATTTTTAMPTPAITRAREQISGADALIAVTPVFTASYSGLFKMFFDSLDPDALNAMPTIIAATAGTPRHSLVLDHAVRPLLTYLRAVVVPTGVFAATEDFGGDEAGAALGQRIRRAAEELAALVVAERSGVEGFVPTEPHRPRVTGTTVRTDGSGFRDLLRAHLG
ncbi:CE1759 family FMN reductase [Rhodococcus chondri]|uniref:NAD(P)H-dependent oxidoreductase n=1 Tax=Rhodococcus chondri TaxID=3065941 RepID=A0ABU7JY87_9NOCA|nr:CE1759 family FMN reductase [Rhodococcus sp. CC-R104]MEE2034884.1 NAD(P)H-dependent oxidoreductase [Rhodococcus sp. CC-R104]